METKMKYIYDFTFVDDEGFVYHYDMWRVVSDSFSAATYAFDWLNIFGDEFGFCKRLMIYEADTEEQFVIVNIERKCDETVL